MKTLWRNSSDCVSWYNSSASSFPLKNILEKIYVGTESILSKNENNFVWSKCFPPRAQMTLWLACLERLKTGDKLVELGALDLQQATCSLCRETLESNSHVLFTCRFSWRVWMNMLKWWGIQGVLQPNCNSFILEWDGLMRNRKWKKL